MWFSYCTLASTLYFPMYADACYLHGMTSLLCYSKVRKRLAVGVIGYHHTTMRSIKVHTRTLSGAMVLLTLGLAEATTPCKCCCFWHLRWCGRSYCFFLFLFFFWGGWVGMHVSCSPKRLLFFFWGAFCLLLVSLAWTC